MFNELLKACEETLFMCVTAGVISTLVGLPLGTLLTITSANHLIEKPLLHKILKTSLTLLNAIPYVFWLVIIIPFTLLWFGNGEGCLLAILPLTIAIIPATALATASALKKVPSSLVESALSLGASNFQALRYVLFPEARMDLLQSSLKILQELITYSLLAGILGSGGLGHLLFDKGYQVFEGSYVFAIAVLLAALSMAFNKSLPWRGNLSLSSSTQKSRPEFKNS